MTENIASLELKSRRTEMEDRRRQQAALLRSAVTGDAYDLTTMAQMRGMVIEERENSIFSDAWIILALLILVVGLIAGRNPALLALGAALLIIVGVSTVWRNLSLSGVTYERSFDRDHVFPGEPVELCITVTNGKPLPLTWLRMSDLLPVSPETDTE